MLAQQETRRAHRRGRGLWAHKTPRGAAPNRAISVFCRVFRLKRGFILVLKRRQQTEEAEQIATHLVAFGDLKSRRNYIKRVLDANILMQFRVLEIRTAIVESLVDNRQQNAASCAA